MVCRLQRLPRLQRAAPVQEHHRREHGVHERRHGRRAQQPVRLSDVLAWTLRLPGSDTHTTGSTASCSSTTRSSTPSSSCALCARSSPRPSVLAASISTSSTRQATCVRSSGVSEDAAHRTDVLLVSLCLHACPAAGVGGAHWLCAQWRRAVRHEDARSGTSRALDPSARDMRSLLVRADAMVGDRVGRSRSARAGVHLARRRRRVREAPHRRAAARPRALGVCRGQEPHDAARRPVGAHRHSSARDAIGTTQSRRNTTQSTRSTISCACIGS